MNARSLGLLLGFAIALSGCGKQQSAAVHSPNVATPATQQAASASMDLKATTLPAGQKSKITRLNEDGSETVDESGSDSATRNTLLAAVASTVAAGSATAAAAPSGSPGSWQEGVNYTRLVPAQPTSVPSGQVEVLEFFWYACPHCYALEPMVESWLKNKPSYVSFSRVHVMWNAGTRSLARLFYTLEILGKLEQLHTEVFKEIHVNGNPLVTADADAAGSERLQAKFAKKFGISEEAFTTAYHSFSVDAAMQKADMLMQRYRVDGVPTFVVNGKFIADVRSADGPERLISLVGDLAVQEHKH